MRTCDKNTKSPAKVSQQKVGKYGKIRYKCKFCPKHYQSSQGAYRHQQKCNAARKKKGKQPLAVKKPKKFECETCLKVFSRAAKLELHKKSHTRGNFKVCSKCSRRFRRRDFYNKHISKCDGTRNHVEENQCSCGKLFSGAANYDIHLATCSAQHLLPEESTDDTSFPSFLPSERKWEVDVSVDNDTSSLDDQHSVIDSFDENVAHSGFEDDTLDADESICVVMPDYLSCGGEGGNEDAAADDDDADETGMEGIGHVNTVRVEGVGHEDDSDNGGDGLTETTPSKIHDEQDAEDHLENNSQRSENSFEDGSNELWEEIPLDDDDDKNYVDLLCVGVLEDLKKIKHRSDKLFSRLFAIFGKRLPDDENLQQWLSKSLGMRRKRFKERLRKWLNPNIGSTPGRPRMTTEVAQTIFDEWISHSTISVDRRDGRDMVSMPNTEYQKRYREIESCLVKTLVNKRNSLIAQVPRYVCDKTVREMVAIIEEKIGKKSIGSVHNFRPFFVVTPTEREKLECLCTVCCNARTMFNALQRVVKKRGLKQFLFVC